MTCEHPAQLAAIIANGDPLDVAGSADRRDGCDDMFVSLDQDDGLTLEEFKLGTSDTNADTDGDGYTDREKLRVVMIR